jgi:penicillin-binding protein 2
MATSDINLADRSGSLVESHKGYDVRIIFFYFLLAALMLTLVAGLAYQQLSKLGEHKSAERQQNLRRVLVPGPRGNIYDRDGRILVTNQPRFSVVLFLDELKTELRREHIRIHKNYVASATAKSDVPSPGQLEQIARVSVAQRYLDQVNAILHRDNKIDPRELARHFQRRLLLPFPLVTDLSAADYARLIEELPVQSPVQVYSSSTRFYPYHAAAAHTLGYVRFDEEVEAEDFPGEGLRTFRAKGAIGKDGLEAQFDSVLQGTPGGSIFRVDPSGFRINPPLEQRTPKQGRNLTTSLDIDLQVAAEDALGDQTGAAVAIDIATGEVLVMASKPGYDLNEFSPRASQATVTAITEAGAWQNLALDAVWPPGSTFKILVSIAGLRSGRLSIDDDSVDCKGVVRIGNRAFGCDNGLEQHGRLNLSEAIAHSCDIYFYLHGIDIGPDIIANEARRFHLDRPTGIELPGETKAMIIPDPAWEKRYRDGVWTKGDTAITSIGQGAIRVTPLQMACFAASVARGDTFTAPTLLHDPARPTQHNEPIGLTPQQRAAIVIGMQGVVTHGTASQTFKLDAMRVPGVQLAGKTGTAQAPGHLNIAWFICFAPADHPQIAVATAIRSDTPGENYAGGRYAAPVVSAILRKYFEKQQRPAAPSISPIKLK